jgi:hypothetical protein
VQRKVNLIHDLKGSFLCFMVPPWQDIGDRDGIDGRTFIWILGWLWTIPGLFIGALFSLSLINRLHLDNSSYQDWLVITSSVIGGFAIQLFGWIEFFLILHYPVRWGRTITISQARINGTDAWRYYQTPKFIANLKMSIALVLIFVGFAIPLATVGFLTYWYLTNLGSQVGLLNKGVLGGFVVKVLLLFIWPLVKGAIVGIIINGIIKWLRK